MSFASWLKDGSVKRHRPARQEIENLLAVADRCLADARVAAVSADGRLQSAYNSALAAATAALHASGYRTNPAAAGHHAVTIESTALTFGAAASAVRKLDSFRRKRHRAAYDVAGAVTEQEVLEAVELAAELRRDVQAWLQATHPDLVGATGAPAGPRKR